MFAFHSASTSSYDWTASLFVSPLEREKERERERKRERERERETERERERERVYVACEYANYT
jgi:hypothetical protein